MTNIDEFRELLDLYVAKGLDPIQKKRFAALLQDPANDSLLEDEMRESFFEQGILTEASDETVDRMMSALRPRLSGEQPLSGQSQLLEQPRLSGQPGTGRLTYMTRWVVAASVLLLAAGAAYFFLTNNHLKEQNKLAAKSGRQDVLPAHKGAAILKLDDGRKIDVDSAATGLIARQGNIEIIKEKNGQISYRGTNAEGVMYNEIETIKGQELSVNLPDGSVASLNTASSIRYPLSFTKNEREISMTGEIHFTVRHDEKQPFRVRVKEQVIEDLGTEFNINAYEDEPVVRTTLVEGSVSIKKGGVQVLLQPGEEAVTAPGKDAIKVSKADLDLNLAWYKGVFSYRHADIPTVMREFSRWYNVEVVFENGVTPDATFTGDMERDLTLSQALDGLKTIGIHYRIDENKRLVILP